MSRPARLRSVRLQGFKSFADRTHVEFGPGISAVVGPNGSGKSNLADALRWALGEQGRALRTRKSEDVVWAGSEKRPAVGMADVQLTLDNADGLLPVEYGVVELGRRLYRSGENDYLLNRARVRLKDLIELLDAGHLAENAFLFIGQGMVDQALALRPEERRPLFEDVAGVRRHERRRRRAEEQLAESEANLARVEDILAELRPQARRLAQQAEQQASRLSAADELARAILASAHARWHHAARLATDTAGVLDERRASLELAMAGLLEQEQVAAAAAAALDRHAAAEATARAASDRARDERAALQLREGRLASEVDAAARERTGIERASAASTAELEAARQVLALPIAESAEAAEADLAALDAEIAALERGEPEPGPSAADLAAIRRLEAARAQELQAARRRADEAGRHAAEEAARAAGAVARAEAARQAHVTALAAREAAAGAEADGRAAREAAQSGLAAAEAAARAAADVAAGARAAAAAAAARHDEARRALDAAEGGTFSKAARARGGRSIGDGLIVDARFRAAVDAALAGFGRAQVLPRGEIVALTGDRGVAIAAEAVATGGAGDRGAAATAAGEASVIDAARARGGGDLAAAVRRDDSGAVARLLSRVVWLPDADAAIGMQSHLPPGWLAVALDGSVVVGELAAWTRPDGRGLHLRADVERLAAESATAAEAAGTAGAALAAADVAVTAARAEVSAAREREAALGIARRRADEAERAAAARLDAAARESVWSSAQAERLAAEVARLAATLPPLEPAEPRPTPEAGVTAGSAEASRHRAEIDALRQRRTTVEAAVRAVRAARTESERRRAQASAAAELAERQLAYAATAATELAEREARLVAEREALVAALAHAALAVETTTAALAAIAAASGEERDRLRAAEAAVLAMRERVRIAQEGARAAESDALEARLALEALRESVLVELAGLGASGLAHLDAATGPARDETAPAASPVGDEEPEAAALEAAMRAATQTWSTQDPPADPPGPTRLAALRRRFHDLGAVNPFAAEEHREVRARLDGLEAQRSDLAGAIDRTRQLIAELDTLVSEQFRRTFAALEKAFDARFQQLFGGGFARLVLTDPQDLAATGVEITARPPGKKPQALAMLSGGERALTAVALLFAMLEVRPVPFCVLDEVDAALDEANIGRFTDALRDLARTTQCIVITHNRGTIEAADAMYGVTVGDDSVSRVISLRLDEATALAERARTGSGRAPVAVAIDPSGS